MSNNISIIPSSSPGDFTVGGILTVNGGLIKIPVSTYFLRFGTFGAAGDGFTVNKQSDVNGQDDISKWANSMLFDTATGRQGGTRQGPSFADQIWHRGAETFSNSSTQTQTGTAGSGNLWSVGYNNGHLDRNGFPFLRALVLGQVQSAVGGAITLIWNIGTANVTVLSVGASVTKLFRLELDFYFDSVNSQIAMHMTSMQDAVSPAVAFADTGIDGSSAWNLQLNYTTGSASDIIKLFVKHINQFNTH